MTITRTTHTTISESSRPLEVTTMSMNIDQSAPVTAIATITVGAAPELIWDLLADINRWPEWNSAVTAASLSGPVAIGARFRWKAGPARLVSEIRTVDRPRQIGWTGRSMGMSAVHVWRLERHGSGTQVHTEESWDGLPARLLRRTLHHQLQKSLEMWLGELKTAAEARQTSPIGRDEGHTAAGNSLSHSNVTSDTSLHPSTSRKTS
jgi:uncharacterized protein YndB with AHSA1/START domain